MTTWFDRTTFDGTAEPEDAAMWAVKYLKFVPDEKQAQVLSTKSKRGILNCTRQWGKSFIGAAKAVHHAHTQPGTLTLVLSPSARQSKMFLRAVKEHVVTMGITPKGDGDNEISMLFPNGSRIVGLPGKEATVRGFSAVSLLLIDEASLVPDELYTAVRPMLATSGGSIWLMSTPRGRRGFFYEVWTKGGEKWERISVKATECMRIPWAHLEEERETMTDVNFRQEYLCEFTQTLCGVFDREMVEAQVTDGFEPLRV